MSEYAPGGHPGRTAAPLPGPPSNTTRAGSASTALGALLITLTGATGLVDAVS